MTTTPNTTTPNTTIPSISPFLFAADVRKSMDFLVAAFGLTVEYADDRIAKATLGDASVFLSAPHEGSLEPANRLPAQHALVMLYVDAVDAVFEQATAAGAAVEYPPQDMPYGQRECGVRDLDGNLWSIATLIPSA